MKNWVFIIFILFVVKMNCQCSFSITTSFTPASCSSCCDGIISASISGSGMPCAPTSWQLNPTGTNSNPATWINLCTGNYTVSYVTSCCIIPVVCSLPFNTNINEKANEASFKVYPNPVANTLKLSIEEPIVSDSWIEIKNAIGQTVLKTELKNEIDVSKLSPGIYFLQIQNSKGQTASKRLIIAK